MRLTYLDESGDDGVAEGSSRLFVLAGISVRGEQWREQRGELDRLRIRWESQWGLPREMELHTRALMLGKRPFSDLGIHRRASEGVLSDLAGLLERGNLEARAFICGKSGTPEGILRDTLGGLIRECRDSQRIYLSDRGRVPAMRRIIVSENLSDNVVESLVELDSTKSCFVQMADAMATAAHIAWSLRLGMSIHARLRPEHCAAALALTEGPNRKCFLVRP